ncbi:hypothetical protein [Neorhizobium sp. T25_13]|uniref:hypothetical protein n=1 Tax=Neorhizobium sp. T25_13 TaxID=2093830 RepID=UPI00155E2860|nr:hypothetical protein [Neorhizobium sp. T25_13]
MQVIRNWKNQNPALSGTAIAFENPSHTCFGRAERDRRKRNGRVFEEVDAETVP